MQKVSVCRFYKSLWCPKQERGKAKAWNPCLFFQSPLSWAFSSVFSLYFLFVWGFSREHVPHEVLNCKSMLALIASEWEQGYSYLGREERGVRGPKMYLAVTRCKFTVGPMVFPSASENTPVHRPSCFCFILQARQAVLRWSKKDSFHIAFWISGLFILFLQRLLSVRAGSIHVDSKVPSSSRQSHKRLQTSLVMHPDSEKWPHHRQNNGGQR